LEGDAMNDLTVEGLLAMLEDALVGESRVGACVVVDALKDAGLEKAAEKLHKLLVLHKEVGVRLAPWNTSPASGARWAYSEVLRLMGEEIPEPPRAEDEGDEDEDGQGWTCPACGTEDAEEHGQFSHSDGKVYCYLCGTKRSGANHPDVTLDTVLSDYCREEGDEDEVEEAVERWVADLEDVEALGCEQVGENEVEWTLTVRQAFWLRRHRGWFPEGGFYDDGEGVWVRLAVLLEDVEGSEDEDDAHVEWAARTLRWLWEQYVRSEEGAKKLE
jgi:hypothetical protein